MSDMTKLSASRLEALYNQYRAELLAISDELIAVGLGAASGDEIGKLAANDDPLAIRYIEAQNAFLEVAYERSARLHQNETTKPVRDKAAAVHSPVRRSPKEEETPGLDHHPGEDAPVGQPVSPARAAPPRRGMGLAGGIAAFRNLLAGEKDGSVWPELDAGSGPLPNKGR